MIGNSVNRIPDTVYGADSKIIASVSTLLAELMAE